MIRVVNAQIIEAHHGKVDLGDIFEPAFLL